jgi:hypothetical protein
LLILNHWQHFCMQLIIFFSLFWLHREVYQFANTYQWVLKNENKIFEVSYLIFFNSLFVITLCSRIPGHWVQPPPPANEIWASYLVRPKWLVCKIITNIAQIFHLICFEGSNGVPDKPPGIKLFGSMFIFLISNVEFWIFILS